MADDDTDPKDQDDLDDTEDEFTPPTREEWERTTAALKKGNDEAKKWRLRAQGKDEKWAVPGWEKPAPTDDEDEEPAKKPARRTPKVDEAAIRREAEEAALAKAKPGLVRAAARDAFRSAGLVLPEKGSADTAYQRAMRLIDMDSVDVDEDGTVTGVDEAVKAVRRDYPELFARRGAARVNAGTGSNGDGAGPKTKGSADKLAEALFGK